MAIRRKRIDAAFRDNALADLGMMAIIADAETDANAWASTLRVADRFGLTVYDAPYLELAQRRKLPLGSLDRALVAAARSSGVQTLGGQ